MSPICQAFVQNAWRKDLCSNCFRSEEEHGTSLKTNGFGSGLKDCGNDVNSNVRRYVGVAGRSVRPGLYSRKYYGSNSWNPLMLDNSNNESRLLKSPGLIKGMNSIIKQENEKNRNMNSLNSNSDEGVKIQRRNTDIINGTNIPKDSWILSQIIGDSKTIKGAERSEKIQGDSSSDLGSDASHDSSSNSGNTSGSCEGDLKGESDTSSIKSEQDSAHEDEHDVHGILKPSRSLSLHKSLKNNISFKEEYEIIGFGGDVDYSDDDEYDDDDDDDNSSISSSELNPEELSMKRLTERNTNFNSENENLEKDPPKDLVNENLTPVSIPTKNVTQKYDFNKEINEKVEELSNRQDVKVKLKRSQPIIGSKPPLKSLSSIGGNVPSQFISSQTTDGVRENVPMQGIKPKFVSKDDEMRENTRFDEIYGTDAKVTSIDEVCSKITSIDNLSPRITSIDDIPPKITSVDKASPKITNIDDIYPKVTSVDASPRITSVDNLDTKITPVDEISPKTTYVDNISSKSNIVSRVLSTNSKYNKSSKNSTEHQASKSTSFSSSSPIASSATITKSSSTSSKSKGENDETFSKSEIENKKKAPEVSPVDEKGNERSETTSFSFMPSKTQSGNEAKTTTSNKVSDGKNVNKCELEKSNTNNSKSPKVTSEFLETTNKEKIIDYSVTSGQNNNLNSCDNKGKPTKANKTEDGVTPVSSSNKSYSTRNVVDKASSGVVPMNMITIQRRSSFMESQLGGAEFLITDNSAIDTNKTYSSSRKTSRTPSESTDSENCEIGTSSSPHEQKLRDNIKKSSTPNRDAVRDLKDKKTVEKSTEDFKHVKSIHEVEEQARERESEKQSKTETAITRVENKKEELNFKICTYENSKRSEDKIKTERKEDKKIEENKIISSEEIMNARKESSEKRLGEKTKNESELAKPDTESLKIQASQSSPLSTFGTPVSTSKGNSSFLHSGAVRPVTEVNEINSIIYSTPEFLKDIKSRGNQLPVTASIQKSALYAPSSNLKGVQLGKPATTPKPNYLKDKPRIPIKPFVSSSSISSRDFVIQKSNQESNEITSEDIPLSNSKPNISSDGGNSYENLNDNSSPSSSEQSKNEEVVYDIPVTVSSTTTTFSAPSPSSSSSGYSTTSNISHSGDGDKDEEKLERSEVEKNTSNHLDDLVRAIEIDDSYQRARFEATKNILSESLSFEHKPIPKKLEESFPEEDRVETKEIKEIDDAELPEEESKITTETTEVVVDDVGDNIEADINIKNTATESTETVNNTRQPEMEATHSYINIDQRYENQDLDSYSSFTDDFDDEEEESEQKREYVNIDNQVESGPPLRRTERSSSATPMFRNSVGPINFCPINSAEIIYADNSRDFSHTVKHQAVRSQSVPRSVDNAIDPSVFGKSRQESLSVFGFVKSGFFRPSSPPTTKRKNSSSERGRDRTKKSHSGFSLKKLLRFGSGEKSFRSKEPTAKEQEKMFQRETRKMKLQIIHPLDYNTNGVEVISRPEKRSPTYDFTGLNDPFIQEALRQQALENNINTDSEKKVSRSEDRVKGSLTSVESSSSKADVLTKSKNSSERKVEKKNSFLRKKRKIERIDQQIVVDSTPVTTYVRPSEPSKTDVLNSNDKVTEYNSSHKTINVQNGAGSATSQANANLGFNSEGRPKPPPPPRKTSLDSNAQDALRNMMSTNPPPPKCHSETPFVAGMTAGSSLPKTEGDTSSLSSTCSSTRPSRPPPPRRVVNSAGLKAKDSLYANLGNARAPFTPRKPGRTSSIKEDEREKRKAPNPPNAPTQYHKLRHQMSDVHKNNRNLGNVTTQDALGRPVKGPAPPTPVTQTANDHQQIFRNHDYEYIPDSPSKNELNDDGFLNPPNTHTTTTTKLPSHNMVTEHEPPAPEGYILPAYIQYSSYFKDEKEKQEAVRSSSSLNQEKTTRQRGRRSSIVTNLSLEDQYGAVVFANLEALSNLLDQMCSRFECGGYERVKEQVTTFSSITLLSRDPISCGLRLFYPASAGDCKVTVMVTPEAKVETDPLLMPSPIVMLKDDIPETFLPSRRAGDHAFTSGSVWILPEMSLCSLEEFSHESQRLLQDERGSDWERRVCLFLLQVVSALKQLQAKGIEETSLDLILVIVNMHNDDNPRLLMAASEGNNGSVIQGSSESYVSLCHCAAAVTQLLLGNTRPLEGAMEGPVLCPPFTPSPHAFVSLISTLREERSSSLTKAKCILETILFGPEDLKMKSSQDSEAAIQKWLDLERANVLHSLVREQANGSFNKKCVLTKFQLLFLVRTNAKALKDAMSVLEGPDVTNF